MAAVFASACVATVQSTDTSELGECALGVASCHSRRKSTSLLQSRSSRSDGNADGFSKAVLSQTVANSHERLTRVVALAKEYAIHNQLLQQSLAEAQAAQDPSKEELDTLISTF